jgi:hypothetical protein
LGKKIKRMSSSNKNAKQLEDYKKNMKKTILVIGLCALLLSMPTLLAFPTITHRSSLHLPPNPSDGTFAGGFGRGHWGFGNFNIDKVNAYLTGVYTSTGYTKLTGEITNSDDEKIGDISATIIFKIIIGITEDIQGKRTPLIVFLKRNQHDQFVGRILISSFRTSPHMWGYLIPNK